MGSVGLYENGLAAVLQGGKYRILTHLAQPFAVMLKV